MKPTGRALTEGLARLGAQVHTILPDGTQVTRDEAWLELVWKYALGYTETIRDDDGTLKEVEHKPVAWAVQFIKESREGKAPAAAPEVGAGTKAVDKVRALVKDRLNSL